MSPEVKKIVYMPITIVSPSRVKRMGAMRLQLGKNLPKRRIVGRQRKIIVVRPRIGHPERHVVPAAERAQHLFERRVPKGDDRLAPQRSSRRIDMVQTALTGRPVVKQTVGGRQQERIPAVGHRHAARIERYGDQRAVIVGLHVELRSEHFDLRAAESDDEGPRRIVADAEIGFAVQLDPPHRKTEFFGIPQPRVGIQPDARAVLKDHLHPLALRNVDFGILRRRKNAADLPVETDADAEHQQAGNQHRSDTQRNAPAAAPDQRRTDAAVNRFGGNPRSRHPLSGFEHAGLLVDKPRQFGGAFGRGEPAGHLARLLRRSPFVEDSADRISVRSFHRLRIITSRVIIFIIGPIESRSDRSPSA